MGKIPAVLRWKGENWPVIHIPGLGRERFSLYNFSFPTPVHHRESVGEEMGWSSDELRKPPGVAALCPPPTTGSREALSTSLPPLCACHTGVANADQAFKHFALVILLGTPLSVPIKGDKTLWWVLHLPAPSPPALFCSGSSVLLPLSFITSFLSSGCASSFHSRLPHPWEPWPTVVTLSKIPSLDSCQPQLGQGRNPGLLLSAHSYPIHCTHTPWSGSFWMPSNLRYSVVQWLCDLEFLGVGQTKSHFWLIWHLTLSEALPSDQGTAEGTERALSEVGKSEED